MGTLTADTLVVSEVFGTVQGEGPSAGRRAAFIRLGGCNLHCAWCDTPYTWAADRFDLRAELSRRPVDDILGQVLGYRAPLVVITGGEPLLHQAQPAWTRLLCGLEREARQIEVETNGTQVPAELTTGVVTGFNVSPKLRSAGDPRSARIVPEAIAALLGTGKAVFKFVCTDADAVDEVAVETSRLGIPRHLVWIMPEGTSPAVLDQRLAVIATPAVDAGFNLTTRLHVHCWGSERAR